MPLYKKFLIVTLLAMLTLYGGIQWKLNNEVKNVLRSYSGLASVHYESARIGLFGEVEISGIRVNIFQPDFEITINELNYSFGSVYKTLFFGENDFEELLVADFYLKLDKMTFSIVDLENEFGGVKVPRDTFSLLESAACGELERIGINEYLAMGYHTIALNADMGFQVNLEDDYTEITVAVDVEELSSVNVRVVLRGQVGDVIGGQINFEKLELTSQDLGLNQRKAKYCSESVGLSIEEYYGQHIKQVVSMLEGVDIQPNEELVGAYSKLIRSHSDFTVSIEPEPGLRMEDIKYYDSDAIKNMLGLVIAVNNQTVNDFFTGWSLEKFEQIAVKKSNEIREKKRLQELKNLEPVKEVERFRTTLIKDIEKYKGYLVKIKRMNGISLEGLFDKVYDERLIVKVTRRGGEATIPIKIESVKELKVYR